MARNGSEPSNLLGKSPFQGGFADRPASYWSKWVCLRVCVSTLCLESHRASAPCLSLSLPACRPSRLSLSLPTCRTFSLSPRFLSNMIIVGLPVLTGYNRYSLKKPGLQCLTLSCFQLLPSQMLLKVQLALQYSILTTQTTHTRLAEWSLSLI